MKPCVIWDLCQTLADTRHRLSWILRKPVNWNEFDKRTLEDKPYQASRLVYQALMAQGIDQIIITGRGERNRELSSLWLMQYDMEFSAMYMRPENKMYIPSEVLKRDLLALAQRDGWHPILAFEDHPPTVRMYRSQNIQCFAADDSSWTSGEFKEVRRHTDVPE